MVAEGSIFESTEQREFNERLLQKITQGAKLADVMVLISLQNEKTAGVKADVGYYKSQMMLGAMKRGLKGRVEAKTEEIDHKNKHHANEQPGGEEKKNCQHKQFVLFSQLGKKNTCADIFKNTLID